MIIYSINVYTSSSSGVRVQQVHCKNCGQIYYYEMLRYGVGRSVGIGVYFMEGSTARRTASQRASWDLENALNVGVDVVPCPECDHVQPEMTSQIRGGQQVPMPGMPPPLVLASEALAGGSEVVQYLVTGRPQQVKLQDGSIDLQMARIELPPACCLCLTPCEARYLPPFRLHEGDRPLRVPMCRSCRGSLKRTNVLLGLGAWLGASSIAVLPALVIPGIDLIARCVLWGMASVLGGSVLMFLLPKLFTTPYRYSIVDRLRGIVRLRFENPKYTALVASVVEASANGGQVFQDLMQQMAASLSWVVDDRLQSIEE